MNRTVGVAGVVVMVGSFCFPAHPIDARSPAGSRGQSSICASTIYNVVGGRRIISRPHAVLLAEDSARPSQDQGVTGTSPAVSPAQPAVTQPPVSPLPGTQQTPPTPPVHPAVPSKPQARPAQSVHPAPPVKHVPAVRPKPVVKHAPVRRPEPPAPVLEKLPPGHSIWVDRTRQRVYAFDGSRIVLSAICSTAAHHRDWSPGRKAYVIPSTPLGTYHVYDKDLNHWSKSFHVHMHYAVFFDDGRAIHATFPSLYRQLGRPASGGCVRLTRAHALTLYRWAHLGDPVHVVRELPTSYLALLTDDRPSHAHAPVMVASRPTEKTPAASTPHPRPGAAQIDSAIMNMLKQVAAVAAEQQKTDSRTAKAGGSPYLRHPAGDPGH